jgi:hypothetical protein
MPRLEGMDRRGPLAMERPLSPSSSSSFRIHHPADDLTAPTFAESYYRVSTKGYAYVGVEIRIWTAEQWLADPDKPGDTIALDNGCHMLLSLSPER